MKLSTKLYAGFGIVVLLTGVLSLMYQLALSYQHGLAAGEKEDLAFYRGMLQYEMDHLNWRQQLGVFQRDKAMTVIPVEKDQAQCAFGKWFYGEGKRELLAKHPEFAAKVAALEEPHRQLHQSAATIESLLKQGPDHREAAIAEFGSTTTQSLEKVRAGLVDLRESIRTQFEENERQHEANLKLIKAVLAFSVVFVMAAGISSTLLISNGINRSVRDISQQLGSASAQTDSAAAEVSASSKTLADGASQQASSIEEISSSLEEMASTITTNADHAGQARELASKARKNADDGVARMGAMSESLEAITTSTTDLKSAMTGIRESSGSISRVIKTIDEIAFQTNILAINAAVEAARAGEAGTGFAVVANEVRSLAKRSAEAATETAGMIEAAIDRSEKGSQVSDGVCTQMNELIRQSREVSQALNEIAASAGRVNEVVAEIATASQEQKTGVEHITSAVEKMDKVTQSNASSAEQTAAAAEQLCGQSLELQSVVRALREIVEGQTKQALMEGAAASSASTPSRPAKTVVTARPTARSSRNGAKLHGPAA